MLSGAQSRWAAGLVAAGLLAAPGARAADSIVEPERLTAGAADQFLAVLDPDAARMFYVSNENATTELFGVDLDVRAPQRLFDEAADVTWPRASPDGRRLLYLSFRSAATGELCLRELKPKSLIVSERRCLTLGGRTAMHALWEPSSKTVLVVSRLGLGGEIDLRRFTVDGPPDQPGEVLLTRDLSSPAISHDGRWLLYVPVTRQTSAVGNPSAPDPLASGKPRAAAPGSTAATSRTKKTLALVRLDDPGAAAREVSFELPGFPGFPAFSADDKFVYFVQYLNDTNHDGVVDANDRGVLFRVPFDPAAEAPIDGARSEQLTSAEWDCQYPFPGKDRLVATCLSTGSLDAFSLPLEGAVPKDWTSERLTAELANIRAPWQRLLLYTRLLELDKEPAARALHLKAIIETHLNMREYQSAGFYAGQLERLAVAQHDPQYRDEEGIAQVLHELARHRRAVASIGEGQSTTAFSAAEHARIDKLEPLRKSPIPEVADLAALAQSELHDGLGEDGRALALLEQVRAGASKEPLVLHLYAQRTREMFEALCDRDKLLAADLLLSEQPALDEVERLNFGQAYLDDLLRGRTAAEREALLEEAGRKLGPESNAAFAVKIARALQGLTEDSQTETAVEARVMALLEETKSFERRHSLVHQTVARAKATDSETLWYDVAAKWAGVVEKERPGRKRSEALYKVVALERAYVEWSDGKLDLAREHFDSVTRHSSALEAYADELDVSLQSGKSPAALEAELKERFAKTPDAPELLFALAHLEARALPAVADAKTVAKQAEVAKGKLRTALHALPNSVPIHYLWAYLRHQEYLRTGDDNTALRANSHYLIVLDLTHSDPRYRAAALAGLGLLHARLGNHSMAASFFEQREKLPFASPISELSICLEHARSLFHSDHESEAAALADRCVALVDQSASLARFLPHALDRSALYHQDAGEPERARPQYERLRALVAPLPSSDPAARRNQFVASLGLASAKLATRQPREALADLDEAEKLFALPGAIALDAGAEGFARGGASGAFTAAQMTEDHAALLAGLRARALDGVGEQAAAEEQTRRRLKLLEARTARDKGAAAEEDDHKLLGLAHAKLAASRYQSMDIPGALAEVEAGLREADALAQSSATALHGITATLLREYAQLHFDGHVPLEQLKLDLPGRLSRAWTEMVDRPQPKWLESRDAFRLYLDRLILEGAPVALP